MARIPAESNTKEKNTRVWRRSEELQPPATGGVRRRRLLVFEAQSAQ